MEKFNEWLKNGEIEHWMVNEGMNKAECEMIDEGGNREVKEWRILSNEKWRIGKCSEWRK